MVNDLAYEVPHGNVAGIVGIVLQGLLALKHLVEGHLVKALLVVVVEAQLHAAHAGDFSADTAEMLCHGVSIGRAVLAQSV